LISSISLYHPNVITTSFLGGGIYGCGKVIGFALICMFLFYLGGSGVYFDGFSTLKTTSDTSRSEREVRLMAINGMDCLSRNKLSSWIWYHKVGFAKRCTYVYIDCVDYFLSSHLYI